MKKTPVEFNLDTSEGHLDIQVITPHPTGSYGPYSFVSYDYEDWEWLKTEIMKSIEDVDKRIEENWYLADLKQCPCCGSTKIHVMAPNDGCRCWDCSLTMPNVPGWKIRWNRRVRE